MGKATHPQFSWFDRYDDVGNAVFDDQEEARDQEGSGDHSTKKCKFCGRQGLHWEQHGDGSWRLHNDDSNAIHKCKAYLAARAISEMRGVKHGN